MAKVTGPLHSDDARGSIAGALVFSNWKGKKYVRQLVTPSNPQTGGQGDQRMILGGTGKAVAKVGVDSTIHESLITLGVIPADQSKQSYLVKRIIDVYIPSATAFESLVLEFTSHTAASDFTSAAEGMGLSDFTIAYKDTTSDYDAGVQLYVLAKIMFFLGLTADPFDTALASWTSVEIAAFVSQLAAA